jgi:hypothetical protein
MQERDRGFGRRSRTPSTFAQIPCGTTPLVTPRTLAQFWTRGALGSWLACGAALTRTLRQVGPDSLDLERVWAASNHVGGKPEPCRRLFRVTTSRSIAASWIPIRLSRCEEGGKPMSEVFLRREAAPRMQCPNHYFVPQTSRKDPSRACCYYAPKTEMLHLAM